MEQIFRICEDRKALDIVVLDVRKLTLITDFFLICHGTSRIHIDAIVDHISRNLKAWDESFRIEGTEVGGWVMIDCGDVLVNVFSQEEREYYGLERLWGDAEAVALAESSS